MDILKKVEELVKPQYDMQEDWIHSWMHIKDVVDNSKKLCGMEGINPFLCIIAAYCHDLGRIEEEKRKSRGEPFLPHALLSIKPTIDILNKVGISGTDFAKIIEAVTIHSYRIYEGDNEVAQILQDADKLTGLGHRGFLDIIKYFGGKDFIDADKIIEFGNNEIMLKEFDKYSLEQLEKDSLLNDVIKGLDFKINYENLFHTKSVKILARERIEYFKKLKEILVDKFNLF